MAWYVRQSAVADSDEPSVLLGDEALVGSLLVAIAHERSGGGADSIVPVTGGYTERARRNVLLLDSTRRQSVVVWDKIAGTGEFGFTATTQDAIAARVLVVEIATDNGGGAIPTFEAFVGADSDTGTVNFLSTGDIPVGATDLAIAVFGIRNDATPPSGEVVEHEIDSNVINSSGGGNGRHIVFAAEIFGSAADVDSQYTHSGGTNSGLVGLLLRYALDVPEPPQELRPDADVTTTGWATAPLWSKLDDDPSAGDVISATSSGGSPGTQYADPNGNGTATAWTNTWTNVDDAVREPAAGDGAVISSGTDEASETLVFTDPTYQAGATYRLWVRVAAGAKRALDVAYSVNGSDPGTGHASRAELTRVAGFAWYSRDLTIASQTELNNLRVQLICNATAGGGGAGIVEVDAVYLEIIGTAVPSQTSVAEVSLDAGSTPDVDTDHSLTVRGRVTTLAGALRMQLFQGAVAKSSELSASFSTAHNVYTLPIASGEAAGITDYSDLRIRFYGYVSGGAAVTFEIDQMWLEIPAAAGPQLVPISLAGTITLTGNLTRQSTLARTLSATLTMALAVQKLHTRLQTLVETVNLSISVSRSYSRTVAGSVTLAGIVTTLKSRSRTFVGAMTLAPTLVRRALRSRPFSGSLTLTPVISRVSLRRRTQALSVTFSGTVTRLKGVARVLTGTFTLAGTVATLKSRSRTFAQNVTLGGVIQRRISKTHVGSMTLTPGLTRASSLSRPFAGTLTLTPVMTALTAGKETLIGAINFTPAMTTRKTLGRVMTLTMTLTGVLSRRITFRKSFAANFTLDGTVGAGKAYARTIVGSFTLTPALTPLRQRARSFAVSLSLPATFTRRRLAPRTFETALALAPTFTARAKHFTSFEYNINFINEMQKRYSESFNIQIPLLATMQAGSVTLLISMAVTLNFIASMLARLVGEGGNIISAAFGKTRLVATAVKTYLTSTKSDSNLH